MIRTFSVVVNHLIEYTGRGAALQTNRANCHTGESVTKFEWEGSNKQPLRRLVDGLAPSSPATMRTVPGSGRSLLAYKFPMLDPVLRYRNRVSTALPSFSLDSFDLPLLTGTLYRNH